MDCFLGNEAVSATRLFFWHRMAPAWWGIDPLTPACPEIIEPYSVPDCMLSWCGPNLFHSLIRRFVCRKGTGWAVPGGMTSTVLLLCWCHMGFVPIRWKIQLQQKLDRILDCCQILTNNSELLNLLSWILTRTLDYIAPLAVFICDQSYAVLLSFVIPCLDYSTQTSFQIVF